MYPQCMKEFYGVYILTNGTAGGVQSYLMVLVSDPLQVQATKVTNARDAEDNQHLPKPRTAAAPKF